MQTPRCQQGFRKLRPPTWSWLLMVGWTAVAAVSLVWNLHQVRQTMVEQAYSQARAAIDRDMAYRNWVARLGGIYVPVTDVTPPNPLLAHIPERDIRADSGKRLTLINSSYFTRLVHELEAQVDGPHSRVVSQKPLRPENRAVGWEERALLALRGGAPEFHELERVNGDEFFRLMRPRHTEPACLSCHKQQGYALGEVLGGIGTSVPMALFRDAAQRSIAVQLGGHTLLWALGISGIATAARRQREHSRERHQAMDALFQEKERAQVTLESIADAVITTDAAGRVQYLNPVAARLTGWSADEARGQPAAQVFRITDDKNGQTEHDPVKECLEQGRAMDASDGRLLIRRDGQRFPIQDSIAPIRNRRGGIIGAVLVFRDISETRRMVEQISYQATHDALTGLTNRREFESRLVHLVNDARQHRKIHALMYLDLDQFKAINDTCGHAAGDELLRQLSALLRQRMRNTDILARLGGDEFGIVLEGCPLDQAQRIANNLREVVRDFRFVWKGKGFAIGTSIGLVPITGKGEDVESLLSAADAACYVAKEKGRNRVHIYKPEDRDLLLRQGEMEWVSRLYTTLEENRFQLYYQECAALTPDRNPQRYREVLLRMKDETGKLIAPGAFIPGAERYSLMPTIDRWVVRTVFRWLAAHRDALAPDIIWAINLSGHTLCDEHFPEYVIDQLTRESIPPGHICFEFSETAAVTHLPGAASFIPALKNHGCRFAVDDFGSGLASFTHLKDLELDYLKIDGSFVRNIAQDPVDSATVQAINDVGHVLGLRTIAEHVENSAAEEKLRAMGVDFAQGFGIAELRTMEP